MVLLSEIKIKQWKKHQFGHLLVVVQLIHRRTQAWQTSSVHKWLACSFFHCLVIVIQGHFVGWSALLGIKIHSCLLRSCLLDGDLLALDGVLLFQECRQDLLCGKDDECEPSRPAGHGVHLQVDRGHLAERGKVFPDVFFCRFLKNDKITRLELGLARHTMKIHYISSRIARFLPTAHWTTESMSAVKC